MSHSGRSGDVPIRGSSPPQAVSPPCAPNPPSQSLHPEETPIPIRVDPEIAALIPGFLANRHKDVESLIDAVNQGDFETARILGHSMKGSGGGYGFDEITDIGAEIEMAARRNDPVAIRSQVKALSRYLARVEIVSDGFPPI